MRSKETVFGNHCQLTFGDSEDLAEIKQENEDSIEITIENYQNNLESENFKEEMMETQVPELSRKRSNDIAKRTDKEKRNRKVCLRGIHSNYFSLVTISL